ncbi:hypothetical protein K9N68_37060 (plasmid) [Kovacikia minuta CCNUW1]|uniref:hypothetical protein n=1 Tax=Kovacikia minuta TaxID=2931930 RepID=UPI001CC93ACA|nr:hypothetical protein [Kovacikia minuta]UBF29824.1 hypothetical protein K9N68_37060 [Kovacikia minuta CCNUW1]
MLNSLQIRINQHQFLTHLRTRLLNLHKLLLDTERINYEQVWGQVSRGELLQLVINHQQFAWLHQLSELIVQIDELLEADEPVVAAAIVVFLKDIRMLLTPNQVGTDFAMKYDAAFQQNPDVVLAHADVVTLLTSNV